MGLTGTASAFVVAEEYRGFRIVAPSSTAGGYEGHQQGECSRLIVTGRTEFEVRQKIDAILGVG